MRAVKLRRQGHSRTAIGEMLEAHRTTIGRSVADHEVGGGIETAEGWLYLAFTLDACSRRCVARYCREDVLAALIATIFE